VTAVIIFCRAAGHVKEAPHAISLNPDTCLRLRRRHDRNRGGTVDVEQLDELARRQVVIGDALSRPRHATAEAQERRGAIRFDQRFGQELGVRPQCGAAIGQHKRLGKLQQRLDRGLGSLSVSNTVAADRLAAMANNDGKKTYVIVIDGAP
jgi:hypothetical protein